MIIANNSCLANLNSFCLSKYKTLRLFHTQVNANCPTSVKDASNLLNTQKSNRNILWISSNKPNDWRREHPREWNRVPHITRSIDCYSVYAKYRGIINLYMAMISSPVSFNDPFLLLRKWCNVEQCQWGKSSPRGTQMGHGSTSGEEHCMRPIAQWR